MREQIILLVDDDIDDTEMFCEALLDINKNIECLCAGNGSQAMKLLTELDTKPQLIFLDINMPIMNGWDCLKLLKKDKSYQDIPVIIISTSSHKNDMETAGLLGATCYFVKPNSFNDLKKAINSIVSNLGTGLKDAISDLNANGSAHIFSFK